MKYKAIAANRNAINAIISTPDKICFYGNTSSRKCLNLQIYDSYSSISLFCSNMHTCSKSRWTFNCKNIDKSKVWYWGKPIIYLLPLMSANQMFANTKFSWLLIYSFKCKQNSWVRFIQTDYPRQNRSIVLSNSIICKKLEVERAGK